MKRTHLLQNCCRAMIACLFATALMAGLSACEENDNPSQSIDWTSAETSTPEEEPTTDQMAVSVTANVPAAVLSQFDDNSTGAAFVKRLPQTSGEITAETRLVVVKGSDALTIPLATIEAMANVYLNGGYLAIETPTSLNMAEFGAKFAVALLKKQNERWSSRFLRNGQPIDLSAEESQAVERIKTRIANIVNIARTNSGGIIDKLKAPIAEMLILSSGQYFMQVPFVEETDVNAYSIDDEGNRTDETFTLKTTRNGFHNGEMADAAAEWLNEVEKPQIAQARSRAATRANAQDAINELMDPSETFTFVGNAGFRNWENTTWRRTNRVKQTIRSWGVHDMDNNKDYYYVKQNVTLSMGEIDGYKIFYPVQDKSERMWKIASGYGNYWTLWYGAFLSKYDTSMELSGKGTIALEAAMPETKNSSTTQSISIGSSHSSTTTIGITGSVNGGYTQTPGWGINIGASGSYSKGYTDSYTFNMGYSRAIEDLTVSKNSNGEKVSWTYEGNKPKGYVDYDGTYYNYCHQTVPEILVNDADLLNEICWSVANPDGAYSIDIYSMVETAALLFSDESSKNNIKTKYEYTPCNEQNRFSHQLLEPYRARQTWRMNITIDEWENGVVNGAQSEIEEYLKNSYPDLYAHEFTICDKTPTSVEVASNFIDISKYIFNNSYDILQSLAKSNGVKQFTIHWRCDDMNITVREGYTVNINNVSVTASTDSRSNNTAVNLFDGDIDKTWLVDDNAKQNGVWFVEFQYLQPIVPTAYSICLPNEKNWRCDPLSWTLMAKAKTNDAWTKIAEVINDVTTFEEGVPVSFPLNLVSGKSWQYFRLEVSESWEEDNEGLEIAEFSLEYASAANPDQTAVSVRFDYDADNTDLIAHYAGKKANITFGGRKFYKNGSWNSLTLPFDLDDFVGTPLEGASVRELKSVECSGNTMTLKFSAVASIKAHRPYIVRWDEGDDLQNPVFSGVTIQDGSPVKVTMSNGNEEIIAFVGVYDPLTLKANDRNKLFFGTDSKLYWPSSDVPVYSNFAYFQLYNTTYTNVVIR